MITIKSKVNVQIAAKGRRTFTPIDRHATAVDVVLHPKIQRITRLMALAIRFDEMVRAGEATDMIDLARRAKVSQPRMSQIMALNLLAPDIQQSLLDLPPQGKGKPFLHEKRLRSLTAIADWTDQRVVWRQLLAEMADLPSDSLK